MHEIIVDHFIPTETYKTLNQNSQRQTTAPVF